MTSTPEEPWADYSNDGKCNSIPCQHRYLGEAGEATHALYTRNREGHLIRAEYCYHDGIWFAGKAALEGRQVISLEEIPR